MKRKLGKGIKVYGKPKKNGKKVARKLWKGAKATGRVLKKGAKMAYEHEKKHGMKQLLAADEALSPFRTPIKMTVKQPPKVRLR